MLFDKNLSISFSSMASVPVPRAPLPPPVVPQIYFSFILSKSAPCARISAQAVHFNSSLSSSSPINAPLESSVERTVIPSSSPTDLWVAKVKASFQPLSNFRGRQNSFSGRTRFNYSWVKHHSTRIYMIYIPCPVIRQWVLDVAFGHSENCSFILSLWKPSLDLSPMKLVHAPFWVLFRKVPRELWSIEGFSTIASGGISVHSELSSLKPYSNGIIKLKVVIDLEKNRPDTVKITDKFGNMVQVSAEFPRLPPKCGRCCEFGHLVHQCPASFPRQESADVAKAGEFVEPAVVESPVLSRVVDPTSPIQGPFVEKVLSEGDAASSTLIVRVALQQSKTLSSPQVRKSVDPSSGGWLRGGKISKVRPSTSSASNSLLNNFKLPVTSSQFTEEEELIKAAQKILRNMIVSLEMDHQPPKSAAARRHARKRQTHKLLLLSLSGSEGEEVDVGNYQKSRFACESNIGSATAGLAHVRSVQSALA
ncbi:unnamed protein product [Microthlaspi erraticum]|uniref:Uncharacterized protein n=1 Tax=Microthlaspi erraticum TaxID=1685480 RepID=A0A6D2JNL1_9BRAS|nr:unnamed protein product [Microthlaspi erraticum]